MQIVSRDFGILQFMLEQRLASANQIKRIFWKDKKAGWATYHRLEKLEKAGYISGDMKIGMKKIYQINKKGYEVLKQKGLVNELSFPGKADYRNLIHDFRMVEVRILFYELGLKKWISERRLRSQRRCGWIPDGILIHQNQARIAIELEWTQKRKNRLQRIFEHYRSSTDLDIVFYLVSNGLLKSKLIQWAKDYPKLFFTLYEELVSKREETVFKNAQDSLRLKDIL